MIVIVWKITYNEVVKNQLVGNPTPSAVQYSVIFPPLQVFFSGVFMNKLLKLNVQSLCRQNHVSAAKVERDLGMADKTIAHLDSNMPSIEKVAALADYFGTTIDGICGRSTELPPDEEMILRKYRCLDDNQKKNVIDYIMFLMSQTPVKNDSAIS